jgi:hypothetical protein
MIKIILIIIIFYILFKKFSCKKTEKFHTHYTNWNNTNFPYYLYNPYYYGIQNYYNDLLPDYIKPFQYIHPLYGRYFINPQYQHYKYPYHTRYLTKKVTYPNK